MMFLQSSIYFICVHAINSNTIQWSETPERIPASLQLYNRIDILQSPNNATNKPFIYNDFIASDIDEIIRQEMHQKKIKTRKVKRTASLGANDTLKISENVTTNKTLAKNETDILENNFLKKNFVSQSELTGTKEALDIDQQKQNKFQSITHPIGETFSFIIIVSIALSFLVLVILSSLMYTGYVAHPTLRTTNKRDSTKETKNLRYKQVASQEGETNSVVNSNSWKTTFFTRVLPSSCSNPVQEDANIPRNEATVRVSRASSVQTSSTKSETRTSSVAPEEGSNQTDDELDEIGQYSTMPVGQSCYNASSHASDSEKHDELNDSLKLCGKCNGYVNANAIVRKVNEIEAKGGRIFIPISIPVALNPDKLRKSTSSSADSQRRSRATTPSTSKREFSTFQNCSTTKTRQDDNEAGTNKNPTDDDCRTRGSFSSTSSSKSKPNEDATAKTTTRKSSRTSESGQEECDTSTTKTNHQSEDQKEYDYVSSSEALETSTTRPNGYRQPQYDSSTSSTNQQPESGDYEYIRSGASEAASSLSEDYCDPNSASKTRQNNNYGSSGGPTVKTNRSVVFKNERNTASTQTDRSEDNYERDCEDYSSTTKSKQSVNNYENESTIFNGSTGKTRQSDDYQDQASTTKSNQSEYYEQKFGSTNQSVGSCEQGYQYCTSSNTSTSKINRSHQSDNCDNEFVSFKASATNKNRSGECYDRGGHGSTSSNTPTTRSNPSNTCRDHEYTLNDASATKKRNEDCSNYDSESSTASTVKSNQSERGSITCRSTSSKESDGSKDQQLCPNTSFNAPMKIKVLSTDPDFQTNTLIVKEHLNKLLSERCNTNEPRPKLTKDCIKTGQVIYADVCFVKQCATESAEGKISASNCAATTVNSVTSKANSAAAKYNKYAASENGNETEYNGSQQGENDSSYFSSFKENARCYSEDERNNSEPREQYGGCTASVCSDDIPRNNLFRKYGNGYRKSALSNQRIKYCNTEDSRAGLIQNLNQRLKGTYLSSTAGSHRSRRSMASRCSPVSEYPTEIESDAYMDVSQPQYEDNEGGNRSTTRSGMHKFLPRIKQYMSKRKKSNSLGSEEAYYSEPSGSANSKMKLCQDCLKHFPDDVGETLRSRRSTFANSKKFQGRSVVHIDEIFRMCPNLCSDLSATVKDALFRSTDNLSVSNNSHLCEYYERGRESKWSELSSSFENIKCLD